MKLLAEFDKAKLNEGCVDSPYDKTEPWGSLRSHLLLFFGFGVGCFFWVWGFF